jgi:hypothetical protein
MIIKPESHMRLWLYILIANETYPLMRTIPSLKEKTMFAGITAIAIAIAALAGEYYVVALTQEH